MARVVVRNPDEDVRARLQPPAVRHGDRSEEERSAILRDAVKDDDIAPAPLRIQVASLFRGLRLDEPISTRRGVARPADFVALWTEEEGR